jgi:hypothetical protein
MDPWTWAGKGWLPKANVALVDPAKIYILDFFGYRDRREMEGKMNVPYSNFLTAYGSPWGNTFLGYFIDTNQWPISSSPTSVTKKHQGVIWGKNHKYLSDRSTLLKQMADKVPLVSTTTQLFHHPNIVWMGHASAERWRELLQESKFLIGLGDPLLGPSALEGIAGGCMYINPTYSKPVLGGYLSQHPFAQDKANDRVVMHCSC